MTAPRSADPSGRTLESLAALLGVPAPPGADDVRVTGVTLASQRTTPGDLYAGLPGARAHGADFATDALGRGAVAVLTDADGRERLGEVDVPVLVVESPRSVLGSLAAEVHDHPARALRLVAVTGTQGKTTTTRLLEGALEAAGTSAAVVGTVGTRIAGADVTSALTTPEAPDLHALFARMREAGVDTCAMEVSSHALVLGRVDGVVFDVAVFTNLGRDHLDFHADVEEYFEAKASLFTPERSRRALVNVDDEHGRILARRALVPTATFSATAAEGADWTARDVALAADGSTFTAVGPSGSWPVRVPLAGAFNVANALAAVAAAAEAGLDPATVAAGLSAGVGVPGRLERVEAGQDFVALVDYAHKPDAVEAALTALRPVTPGRVIMVLGAGGDRDTGKRPVMGEIAARLADVLVVTDDNPRSEDPAAIRAAVLAGAAGPGEVREVEDRRAAIAEAVALAGAGDTVVVAGKGHETGQEVAGVVHPFDDRVVLREEIARAGGDG